MKSSLEKIIGESELLSFYFKDVQVSFMLLALFYYVLIAVVGYFIRSHMMTLALMVIFLLGLDWHALKVFNHKMEDNHKDIYVLKNFDYSANEIYRAFSRLFLKDCLKAVSPIVAIHFLLLFSAPSAYEIKLLLSLILTLTNTGFLYIKIKNSILKPIVLKKDIFGR